MDRGLNLVVVSRSWNECERSLSLTFDTHATSKQDSLYLKKFLLDDVKHGDVILAAGADDVTGNMHLVTETLISELHLNLTTLNFR